MRSVGSPGDWCRGVWGSGEEHGLSVLQAEAGGLIALPRALCPQVANHVVQALLNQKVSSRGRHSHPEPRCPVERP